MLFLTKFKWYFLAASYAIVLAGTLYGCHVWHGYKEKKEVKAQVTQLIQDRDTARKASENLSALLSTTQQAYVDLRKKKNETRLITGKCTLTADAVRLWNESLFGARELPNTTSGTIEVGGTSTVDDLYDNKLLNDEIYNRNRDRNKALNKWVKDTYGK